MSFAVPADAYDRFMGRYSILLSPQLADLAGIVAAASACSTSAVARARSPPSSSDALGPAAVSAVDPSAPFVAAARTRNPERRGAAGLGGGAAVPGRRVRRRPGPARRPLHVGPGQRAWARCERVTRPGGVVAACVWDHAGGKGPLSPLWDAARELDPDVTDESRLMGSQEGDLAALFASVGSAGGRARRRCRSASSIRRFEEWWEPFTLGVGPAGRATSPASTTSAGASSVSTCAAALPTPPFVLTARAWTVRAVV